MKKYGVILTILLLCSGCAASETFETLGQVQHQSGTLPAMSEVCLQLPEDAAVETFAGEEIGVYDCGEYAVVLQTVPSGNFDSTVKSVSGFAPDQLTVLESRMDGVKRYDWVWTAAAEVGDVLCRAAVLDDGKYHYCLSVIAPAGKAGALTQTWNQLFGSFRLE